MRYRDQFMKILEITETPHELDDSFIEQLIKIFILGVAKIGGNEL